MSFDLLDHEQDTLRVILSYNYWRIHHIMRCLYVFLMKNSEKCQNFTQIKPITAILSGRGVTPKKKNFFYYLTGQYVSFLWQNFCCKAYQWPIKALILENSSKIGRKSPKYPPRALFGGPTKIFFLQNASPHHYERFLWQKFCSKIKNKKLQNFSDAFGP